MIRPRSGRATSGSSCRVCQTPHSSGTRTYKTSLESRVERLDSVVFQKGLGSLRERSARVARLASSIAGKLGCPTVHAARAALLAKADLLTQMVGEFPELQGRMGYHYAKLDW